MFQSYAAEHLCTFIQTKALKNKKQKQNKKKHYNKKQKKYLGNICKG